MNILGVGGAELVLLLVLGGVILGPRRLVGLARDAGRLVAQVRSLTAELTRQVNKEIALLDLAETKQRAPASRDPGLAGETPARLPEAYQRFRDDFPAEGELDSRASAAVAPPPETPDPSPAAQ
ncbi:MAG: hypothetical protein IT318_05650 [Anaerolineales bacterium]|nr:hypothetical protein [Anaerolineales bacterium]